MNTTLVDGKKLVGASIALLGIAGIIAWIKAMVGLALVALTGSAFLWIKYVR